MYFNDFKDLEKIMNFFQSYKYCMRRKYTPKPKYRPGEKGRPIVPDRWCTGPDPLRREKYYAWLKHRAQARHRKEDYDLTWPEWEDLWTDDAFLARGRNPENLCLTRIDQLGAWSRDNVEVVTRLEHLRRPKEKKHG